MRVIRAYQTDDGAVHLTPEAAARHDFQRELQTLFSAQPTVDELTVNMDQIQRIIERAKGVDTSFQPLRA